MNKNPKSEIQGPKEIRTPKRESVARVWPAVFGFRPSSLLRISAFGLRIYPTPHFTLSGTPVRHLTALLFWLFISTASRAAAPHFVFAHYMVCFATYGESVDGYKREIQEAQAAGIDGFALNVGAWDDAQPYYKSRVELMYQAAEQLDTGFKLFFSVDFENPSNTVSMIKSYANRTNTFRYQGKIVLSSYGHNDVPTKGWAGVNWTNILSQLNTNGYPIFFIPYFFSYVVNELPAYSDGVGIMQKYPTILDGLFWYGAAGLPDQLAQCNSNYNAAAHSVGKPFMASIAPQYWGCRQYSLGRRYYEFSGGQGLINQWQSIISNQPDWVEIVTWNDFNESSYISPVDDAGQYFSELQTPHRYSHRGYLALSKRYIAWFKNGADPGIANDSLFYCYRPHAKGLVASDTNDIPITWLTGDVQDTIYVTACLTAPGTVVINSGGSMTTNSLPAGTSQCSAPFAAGRQILTLTRGSATILSAQGPDIPRQITNYDFFPVTGVVYPLAPPGNLRVYP